MRDIVWVIVTLQFFKILRAKMLRAVQRHPQNLPGTISPAQTIGPQTQSGSYKLFPPDLWYSNAFVVALLEMHPFMRLLCKPIIFFRFTGN